MNSQRLPIVLRNREPLGDLPFVPAEYDWGQDMWMLSGVPLVDAEVVGRTQITETREGVDQPESHGAARSHGFGTTIETRTREGIDQPEHAETFSIQRCKTLMTKTVEGVDQEEH